MQNIQSTKISSRNQTAVPSMVRKALNMRPGDTLYWHIAYQNNQPLVVASTHSEKVAKQSRGLGKHLWETIDIETYINNLRQEWTNQM